MSYTRTWGQPVRDAVEKMALGSTATARAIHEGLCAGVAPDVGPDDVPPLATIQRWVFEHRRAAREAVNGIPGLDVLGGVAHTLGEKLKKRARDAKTPADIAAVAKAARELAALKRDLSKEAKAAPAATGELPDTAPAPDEAFIREMAEREARTPGDAPPLTGQEGHAELTRGPHNPTHHPNDKHERAAAS